jgi:hypothetical protein
MVNVTPERMLNVWQQDRDHYIHPWTDFATFKETGSMVVN